MHPHFFSGRHPARISVPSGHAPPFAHGGVAVCRRQPMRRRHRPPTPALRQLAPPGGRQGPTETKRRQRKPTARASSWWSIPVTDAYSGRNPPGSRSQADAEMGKPGRSIQLASPSPPTGGSRRERCFHRRSDSTWQPNPTDQCAEAAGKRGGATSTAGSLCIGTTSLLRAVLGALQSATSASPMKPGRTIAFVRGLR